MKVIDTLTQEDFHGAFQKLLERCSLPSPGPLANTLPTSPMDQYELLCPKFHVYGSKGLKLRYSLNVDDRVLIN